MTSPESDKRKNGLRFNRLSQWLEWQEGLHFTAIELGLERCRRVADNMGLLKPAHTVISIAGTNGKGSTANMLELVLLEAGYKIGKYTSPHIIRYNERICINGEQANDQELCKSFDRIDRARGDISLTYFEFSTLAALDLFRQHDVDIAILEVGLGGRLDAVNILDADIAIISSIDIDHENWLGDNREDIGREKSGIFRNLSPAVCSDPNPPKSVLKCAKALGTPLYLTGKDFSFEQHETTWDWQGKKSEIKALPLPTPYCSYQVRNAASVLQVLDIIKDDFPVSRENISNALEAFKMPGRFQLIPGDVHIILDVAHNVQAANMLLESLALLPKYKKLYAVVGMLRDKDHEAVLKILSNVVDAWHVISLAGERGCESSVLQEKLTEIDANKEIVLEESVASAIENIKQIAAKDDLILVTGSFLPVSQAVKYLDGIE